MERLQPGDPRHVGDYQVLARLGAGGMGQVFLARSRAGREVALKLVHPALAGDPEFRARFRREVTTARAVSGAFTAPVVGADPDAPVPWLATVYLRGLSLHHAVAQHGPLPLSSVIALAAGLAEALVAIHDAGVVHRDLKPSNVMLTPEGPRVIDFGIARAADGAPLTATGSAVGSPGYMAPEQLSGRGSASSTPATDVFALGAVLGYAATGVNPFGRGPAEVLLYRVLRGEPDLAAIADANLRRLVERCLTKDPERRPTPDRILAELAPLAPAPETLLGTDWLPETFSADIAGRIVVPPLPPEPAASPSRRAVLFVAGSGLAGIAAAALGVTLVRWARTTTTAGPTPPVTRAPSPAVTSWRRELPVGRIEAVSVAEGVVFVAAGESGVHALDGVSGESLWQAPLRPDTARFAPLVRDGTAYVCDAQTVEARDLRTGEVRWTGRPRGSLREEVVTAAGNVIVAVTADEVVAFDAATGQRRWARSLGGPGGTPAVSGQILCVAASERGSRVVLGLDPRDGRTRWTRPVEGFALNRPVVAASGSAYIVGEERIHAIDGSDGSVRWRATVDGELPLMARPVVVGSQVLLHDRDGTVYAFDGSTGDRAWKQEIAITRPARDLLDLYGLTPLVVSGRMLMYDHAGQLLAMDQGTGEVHWRRSVEKQINRWPVATRGAVHVKGVNTVVSIDVGSGRIIREQRVPLTFSLRSAGDLLYLVGETTVSAMRSPTG
ncbi:hypothetical protein E1286_35695 [Nonomuraea terrae]|uniref:Protein kinase domain-containing protein n=1 Tax=Nonomuraea terrae TaxID=2530383 RepID=A0A4R4Y408_9ACTN|nr:serine/threonine-protein kinase [Nonomuraea terrae]TDD39131.1 hypothetical protein E1286_35695 [Nonomuraea terrae]